VISDGGGGEFALSEFPIEISWTAAEIPGRSIGKIDARLDKSISKLPIFVSSILR